ncbi:MAG: class I SAM-dependent methyltransferase [Candidatus Omnitrophica bacterium]|nr:class I SAM-dependent methyltransferase [Candidatus Omnitrophota bacterium]
MVSVAREEEKSLTFRDVSCALCGPGVRHRVLYPARLDSAGIKPEQLFSSRRIPGRIHFRIVTCDRCGLVYSNPIFDEETISRLYAESQFIDDPFLKNQFINIKQDYGRHLKKAAAHVPGARRLLDIGCGNGFFLSVAREQGFSNIKGVEPGRDACAKADPDIRPSIVQGTFTKDLFPRNSFDIVSAFHVLDHLLSPADFLNDVREVLRPGGIVLLVAHNVRFWVTRLAGEHAPMFHIEHVYLFDPRTARMLLEKSGFDVLEVEDLTCTYTLAHALKMVPMPISVKTSILKMLEGKPAADIKVRLSPGDMLLIARKPGEGSLKKDGAA